MYTKFDKLIMFKHILNMCDTLALFSCLGSSEQFVQKLFRGPGPEVRPTKFSSFPKILTILIIRIIKLHPSDFKKLLRKLEQKHTVLAKNRFQKKLPFLLPKKYFKVVIAHCISVTD